MKALLAVMKPASRPCRCAAMLTAMLCVLMAGRAGAQEAAQEQPERAYKAHVVLAGDSTVTDDAGWGTGFAACMIDEVKCTNMSRGGRSSSSFREEGRWDQVLALKPDFVLIQFGHNDQPGHPGRENEADKGYKANIERYVDEARAAGIKPVLVTPISRRQWGKDEGNQDRIVSTLEPYAEVVRGIAKAKDVPLIDLHWRSKEVYESLGRKGCEMISPKKENGQWDGTHMNKAGAVMFGSMVAMDCRWDVPVLGSYFRTSKIMALQRDNRPPSMSEVSSRPFFAKDGEPVSKGDYFFTVARDGSGDFRTLKEAIAAAPENNSDRTVILLKPGIYIGQIIIPANKPNIWLIGADRKQSIISYALTVHDPVPPEVPRDLAGNGMVVLGDGFHAANLTIRQIAGDHGQAIALWMIGDRGVLRDCDLLGWQDTVRLGDGRHYLNNCYIDGRVDYIYGGATAVLENCTAHTKAEGYVTAASTPAESEWGYVFMNCKLTGNKEGSVLLGRPWRPNSSVTYLNCEMDASIAPEGWNNWGRESNEQTARYAEYGSTGPGAAPDKRVGWSKQLTKEEAEAITVQRVLGGKDGWDVMADYKVLGRQVMR